MANELTVFIGGREAIPVRIVPYVVPQPLSADFLAEKLSQCRGMLKDCLRNVFAYTVSASAAPVKIEPQQWEGIADNLKALEAELRGSY